MQKQIIFFVHTIPFVYDNNITIKLVGQVLRLAKNLTKKYDFFPRGT
jgi:hypothetical protein